MSRIDIRTKVINTVNNYVETQGTHTIINEKTVLFGEGAILDSMGLVNVIIDIESEFLDENIDISLTSETAMSGRRSPFRNIETLAQFILEQIEGNDE